MRQRILVIAAGFLTLVAALVFAWNLLYSVDREPTLAELADAAQTATDHVERERATVALGSRGVDAIPYLRKLAATGSTDEVRAAALYSLGTLWDFESMDLLLAGMEDTSPVVRSRAGLAVARMLSRNRRFQAQANEAQRKRIVELYRADWEQLRNAPYFDQYLTEVKNQNKSHADE